jgi:hypothetical protein
MLVEQIDRLSPIEKRRIAAAHCDSDGDFSCGSNDAHDHAVEILSLAVNPASRADERDASGAQARDEKRDKLIGHRVACTLGAHEDPGVGLRGWNRVRTG